MMSTKQRVSILAATVLPTIALAVYFLLGPPSVRATSCPDGTIASPCSGNPNNCGNGAGGCFSNGSTNEPYVFCPYFPPGGRNCTIGGPGSCHNGCVTCRDATKCTG